MAIELQDTQPHCGYAYFSVEKPGSRTLYTGKLEGSHKEVGEAYRELVKAHGRENVHGFSVHACAGINEIPPFYYDAWLNDQL